MLEADMELPFALPLAIRPGKLVTDSESAALKERLWGEITAVLKDVDPDVPTEF